MAAVGKTRLKKKVVNFQGKKYFKVNNIYTGASTLKKTLKNWYPTEQSADSDIIPSLNTLRARSRNLFQNNCLGASAINGSTNAVIGSGLKLNAQIDQDYLNYTDKKAQELNKQIEFEFELWANSIFCDSARTSNFYQLQEIAFHNAMLNGDVFGLLPFEGQKDFIYKLSVQLIEADRVSNPGNAPDSNKTAGGITVGKTGAPEKYHIAATHPGSIGYSMAGEWKTISRFGRLTKRLQVLHLFHKLRPGQRRGVPMLATVIEKLRQLGRYEEAEIDAAVISSLYTVFIKTDSGSLGKGDENSLLDVEGETEIDDGDYALGTGTVLGLQPDQSIEQADPKRPNENFMPFFQAVAQQVGAAVNIPVEVLLNHFTASYSASRAALLRAWNFYKVRRAWIVSGFIDPIYKQWFDEAVLTGRISAPGYFDDPGIQKAFLKSRWTGAGMGQIDPVKETKAAILRRNNNLSTGQEETATLNGTDYEANIRQNARENILKEKLQGPETEETDPNVPEPSALLNVMEDIRDLLESDDK